MNNKSSIFDFVAELKGANKSQAQIARSISSYMEFEARDSLTPYMGQFELTPYCNLNCKMCYVHLDEVNSLSRSLLDADTWKKLMCQAIDAGMVKARLSGGECLLYPGFDELYLFLKAKGILVSVLTNGLLLDHRRIDFFKTNMPEKIQISLYGSSDEAYEKVSGKKAFSIVFKNIVEAKKADLPIVIAITPSKYIESDLKNIMDLVNELELEYSINNCLVEPRAETNRDQVEHDMSIDSYLDFFKYEYKIKTGIDPVPVDDIPEIKDVKGYEKCGIKCGAGRSKFTINWQGVMHPCNLMETISAYPLVDGIEKSWKHITKECMVLPQFNKCKGCSYEKMCTFCLGINEQLGSRYELSDFWCERSKKRAKSGLMKYDI